MRVKKRDGSFEPVSFDKISKRLENLKIPNVDTILVAQKVIQGIYDGVTTVELDTLSAETAIYMSTSNPNYEKLAVHIAVSNLHKETPKEFNLSNMSQEVAEIFQKLPLPIAHSKEQGID